MADSAVKIYGFVNDTAFFNREFVDPSPAAIVDQGACCITDKIAQMFGEPSIIPDPRTERVKTAEIMKVSSAYIEDPDGLKEFLQDGNTHLKGKMSIMADFSKLSADVKEDVIAHLTANSDQTKALMSFIEILGNYQVFESNVVRGTQPWSEAERAAVAYAHAAGDATVDEDAMLGHDSEFFQDAQYVYHEGFEVPSRATNRFVRQFIVINFNIKDSKDQDLPIQMHLWFDRDAFLESYPLSTITDVILPCKKQYLYELLDHFKTVSQFTEDTSEYYRSRMDEIVRANDHTGVVNFTTNYYAYPDTQPTNTFRMTFGCVYKGAVPSLDEIKERLRQEILAIDPTISEEMWRKKLPGLIADRQFFLIPVYDNVWRDDPLDPDEVSHRKGIFDLTRNATLIRKCLSADYVEQLQYVQIVSPKYSKYPMLCVPHLDNPSTARLISNLYPDYIGLRAGEVDPEEGDISKESVTTQDFTNLLNSTLADAAANRNGAKVNDFPQTDKLFCHFTPRDGSTYYIITKRSFETYAY